MAGEDPPTSETLHRTERLTPIDRDKDLLPLRRAQQLTRCFLYWIPVNSFAVPVEQKNWLMLFFDGLIDLLKTHFGLRPELFLQFKVLYPNLMKAFLDNASDFNPLPGLGRRPGTGFPELPPMDELVPELMKGNVDVNKFIADYCYWFVDKAEKKQRELFFGWGGMSFIFLKPDPKTTPPEIPFSQAVRKQPIFQEFDVDRIHARTFALLDGFQSKSKKLFGAGLENDSQFKGLPFILPLLTTRDFFNQSEEEVKKWFEVFDVYVNESQTDRGIVLASKIDLDEPLIVLLQAMKEKGFEYRE